MRKKSMDIRNSFIVALVDDDDDENTPRLSYEPLEHFNSHD